MPQQREGLTQLFLGDALSYYSAWPEPTVIVSDGAYGIGGFEGDPFTADGLADWYRPHIEHWSSRAMPATTLWFWNTEIGWATVHPILAAMGWEYRNCHIWNKGIAHIAGNANTQTLRKFPVVTEVCVQYTRRVTFSVGDRQLSMKEWLRHEWHRTGLPFHEANKACGVKNAATRKYFTADHLWYYPPVEAFQQFVAYANRRGRVGGRPYFSRDGVRPITGEEWGAMRAKFCCDIGITNVWNEPAMRGEERLKDRRNRCVHLNQKPLRLLTTLIKASSDAGDIVWEPFGGLCSVAVACSRLGRNCYSAEISPEYFDLARSRLDQELESRTRGFSIASHTPSTPVARAATRNKEAGTLRTRERGVARAPSLFPT